MLNKFKNLLHYTYRERRGLLILYVILCLQFIYLLIDTSLYRFFTPHELLNQNRVQTISKHIQNERKKNKSSAKFKKIQIEHIPRRDVLKLEKKEFIKPSPFNPNTSSYHELLEVGVPERQVRSIIAYRNKGGRFVVKSDLEKIYGLSDSVYNRLCKYIQLPDSVFKEKKLRIQPIHSVGATILLDLNLASEKDLKSLKGIGPSFSRRILKYKELLGGFCSKSQLKEVYGVDDTLFNKIKDHLEIRTLVYRKININESSTYQMSKHPYITWNLAALIEDYRKTNGEIKDVNDLYTSGLLNLELYSKIAPYLTTED